MRVLILGGTTEARVLKEALGDRAILSLARTTALGGAEGLRRYVAEHRITTIVDATHPFAIRISANAAQAGVPLVRLERPPYERRPGDDWTYVRTLRDAPIPDDARVFLTTGHHELEALAAHPAFFLVRALTAPGSLPPRHEILLAKGPFTPADELELIDRFRLTHLVTKDSGGPDAKLAAARARNLRVMLVERPRKPPADTVLATPEAVLGFLFASTDPAR